MYYKLILNKIIGTPVYSDIFSPGKKNKEENQKKKSINFTIMTVTICVSLSR